MTLPSQYHNKLYGVASISRLLKIISLFCRIFFFYRALLQKRPIILRSLPIVATSYHLNVTKSIIQPSRTLSSKYHELSRRTKRCLESIRCHRTKSFVRGMSESWLISVGFQKTGYDRFHCKYYTLKIHQIDKLKYLGTNSN